MNSYQSLKGVLIVLAVLALSGCMTRSTPPGASTAAGAVGAGDYTFLQWNEGLTIMIWDDIRGSHSNHASGSTSDPVFRQSGQAESPDGRSYSYQVETEDGLTARFSIDGKEFDLSQGTLFLVKTRGGETGVQQLSRDLSEVSFDNQAFWEFAASDPDVAELISYGEGR
jgi:hypothetical protein